MTVAPTPPSEWPEEICNVYSPVRVIGKGGFASVWMARAKQTKQNDDTPDDHVAIKIMKDDGYAQREIEILSELSTKYAHPNIIRLLHHCKAEDRSTNCMVLSLVRGPTLNHIINKNGALGLVIAQSISRQLIDAVAHLHGHAVIHRDITPYNIIVSGTQVNDDLWWSDEIDVDGKVAKMAKNCHATLVDFGFARALSSHDILVTTEKGERKSYMVCVDEPLRDNSQHDKTKSGNSSRGRSRSREKDLDSSVSRKKVRDLSALGTRNYAAPEILSGMRNFASGAKDALSSSFHKNNTHAKKKKALGEFVSNYGMTADAFSVGATIRHMVTGVPPSINVEDFLASKNHPLKKFAKSMKKRIKKDDKKRHKKYKLGIDLPQLVEDLIQKLTYSLAESRATVRSVTVHPWIKASREDNEAVQYSGGPIVYLECGQK